MSCINLKNPSISCSSTSHVRFQGRGRNGTSSGGFPAHSTRTKSSQLRPTSGWTRSIFQEKRPFEAATRPRASSSSSKETVQRFTGPEPAVTDRHTRDQPPGSNRKSGGQAKGQRGVFLHALRLRQLRPSMWTWAMRPLATFTWKSPMGIGRKRSGTAPSMWLGLSP